MPKPIKPIKTKKAIAEELDIRPEQMSRNPKHLKPYVKLDKGYYNIKKLIKYLCGL